MKRHFGIAVALGALLIPVAAGAVCSPEFHVLPNLLYGNPAIIDPHESHVYYLQSRPYWSVLAAERLNPYVNSDYDVAIYQSDTGPVFEFPEPICRSGLLAVSARASSTDFIIGDFNRNPYGYYYARVNCYSGACDGVNVEYRDGGNVLTVNSPGFTESSLPYPGPSHLIHVYDVYLDAGVHYYFNFQATDALQQKMLLFSNPANGVYWADRNGAVFETSGCTTYDAPSSGYYGLVVVADGYPSAVAGSFTVSVTTQPVCSCPGVLAQNVPVATAAGPAIDYRLAIQTFKYWNAVGLRSNSDWDMQSATIAHDMPNVNCADVLLGGSYQASDPVEVIVSDGNHIVVPDTAQITSATFVGIDAATIEMDGGPDVADRGSWKFGGSLGADNVAKVWDVRLEAGEAYGLKLQSFGTSARALLFRNPGTGRYVAGRTDAVLSTADTATYIVPANDVYGLVLLHEDATAGGVLLEAGNCLLSPPLVDGAITAQPRNFYTSFTPTVASWGVASAIGQTDYDIQLYGGNTGSGYPDCYSDPSASSNAAGVQAELMVGNFQSGPLTTTYARFFDFAMTGTGGWAEWSQAHVPVIMNGPIVADDMLVHVAVVHEIQLIAGSTIQIEFVPVPAGKQSVLLFGDSGNGAYWAPRSAALTQTNSSVSFTPPYTGSYALVVVDDGFAYTGNTYLSVTGGVLAAPLPVVPRVTRLASTGPNPSRGTLDLRYELADPSELSFALLDVTGRVVSHLGLGHREAGAGRAQWALSETRGSGVAPGVYFLRMSEGTKIVGTQRVTLMR